MCLKPCSTKPDPRNQPSKCPERRDANFDYHSKYFSPARPKSDRNTRTILPTTGTEETASRADDLTSSPNSRSLQISFGEKLMWLERFSPLEGLVSKTLSLPRLKFGDTDQYSNFYLDERVTGFGNFCLRDLLTRPGPHERQNFHATLPRPRLAPTLMDCDCNDHKKGCNALCLHRWCDLRCDAEQFVRIVIASIKI